MAPFVLHEESTEVVAGDGVCLAEACCREVVARVNGQGRSLTLSSETSECERVGTSNRKRIRATGARYERSKVVDAATRRSHGALVGL